MAIIRRSPTIRAILLLVAIFCIFGLFLISSQFHENSPNINVQPSAQCSQQLFRRTFCLIDGKRRIPCIRRDEEEEVFLPFNGFLRNRFDLSGQFGNKSGIFEYFTSDVKMTKSSRQRNTLNPMDTFNGVAMRQRVKCLNPVNGLPMTIQWEPTRTFPYFYPVQILQFGFEHFTKNRIMAMANLPVKTKSLGGKRKGVRNLRKGETEQFFLFPDLPILFFKWKPSDMDAHFEVIFVDKKDGQKMRLEFRQSKRTDCLWKKEKTDEELHFVFGLSTNSHPIEFLLDLPIFVEKALAFDSAFRRSYQRQIHGEFESKQLRIFGPSILEFDSIRQQNVAHHEIFWRVANWLIQNQDEKGGWPVPMRRAFDIDGGRHQLLLESGWHNAMAQGHALSFLSRAFVASGDQRFLEAAHRALDLFQTPAKEGGIQNRVFGVEWFEEYPTWPNGTFVLNGFLYALIGLFDFSAHSNHSQQLFHRGVSSLRQLLPLYDLGQRSAYDLRHIRLGSRPNVARWDYHVLHISLLNFIHSATGEPLFGQIAQRWTEYAQGMEMKHN